MTMTKFLADDGNAEIEVEADNAEDAAQQYVDTGDWGEVKETTWIDVRTLDLSEPNSTEWVWHTIALEPEPPKCSDGDRDSHDWHSPIEIVGGIKENPGVWGHGGGVIIYECCMYCGCARITDTWAQRSDNGQQGLRSVSYELGKYTEALDKFHRK